MTPYAELVLQSDIAASILTNEDFTDVELIGVHPVPVQGAELDALAVQFADRNLGWIGVVGRVEGKPRVALKIFPDDPRCISALSAAFARYCEVLGDEKGDEVDWLRDLWSLPSSDMRP